MIVWTAFEIPGKIIYFAYFPKAKVHMVTCSGFASFVAPKHIFCRDCKKKSLEIHWKIMSLRANAQKSNVQDTFGSKVEPAWPPRPSKWSPGAPKVSQKASKGSQWEPEGSQKDVKREPRDEQKTSKYWCPKIVRKKGALFPVLRHILGVLLGAKLHQKRIKNPIWNFVLKTTV